MQIFGSIINSYVAIELHMKKRKLLIEEILRNRKNFIEILLLAVLVSISVNLLSASFIELHILKSSVVFFLSIIFVVLLLIYIFFRIIGSLKNFVKYEGFIAYQGKSNSILSAPRYNYLVESVIYLNALFAEIPTLKTKWDDEPITKIFSDENNVHTKNLNLFSVKIIKEMTEYFFINVLSGCLIRYSNREKFLKKYLKIFSRNEIPDTLLSNRFLELFSRSMDERPLFEQSKVKSHDDVLMKFRIGGAIEKKGVLFQHFELFLPKNSKFKRGNDGHLIIETKRFILEYESIFEGYNTVLPKYYEKYVLGIEEAAA
jgi:hypothetical protein